MLDLPELDGGMTRGFQARRWRLKDLSIPAPCTAAFGGGSPAGTLQEAKNSSSCWTQ